MKRIFRLMVSTLGWFIYACTAIAALGLDEASGERGRRVQGTVTHDRIAGVKPLSVDIVRLIKRTRLTQGLKDCNKLCLDACEDGPSLVIYPDAIWYKNVDINDCNEIYEKSIKDNKIIERLHLKDEDSITSQ